MEKVVNKFYRDFPICFKSYRVVENKIILTFINLYNGFTNKIYVDYLDRNIEFDIQSNEKIISCVIDNINPNLIGIIVFKGTMYNNKELFVKDYKLNSSYIKPKSIHILGRERFLYKNEFSKINNYPKKNIIFIPNDNDDYWNCVCGNVNFGTDTCDNCKLEKEKVFSIEPNYGKYVAKTQDKINISINAIIYFMLILAISFFTQSLLGDFVFENLAKNNFLGIINRVVVPICIVLLTVINIYALNKYVTTLIKITSILRIALICYLNIFSMIFTVISTYNIIVIIGLDIVFFVSYLIYWIKHSKNNLVKMICPILCLLFMGVYVSKTIYYSDYNLKVIEDGILYYAEVDESETEYYIPNKIDNIKVTEISFMNDTIYNIEKLYISKHTRKIHKYSNGTLPKLIEIILDEENDNYYIDNGILYTKTGMVEYVPSSVKEVTINTFVIEKETFKDALGLETLYIGKDVEKIEFGAFSGCVNLRNIYFDENSSLKNIESNAFMNTGVVDVCLPISIEILGKGIFEKCNKIESLKAPFIGLERENDPNDYLAQDLFVLFFGTGSYAQSENIPESLKRVEIYDIKLIHNVTFYNAKYIEEIVLPNNLYYMGKNSFYGCESLKSFVVPSKVEVIKENCFEKCSSLQKIVIPESVVKIEKNAFKECSSLTEVIYEGDITNLVIEEGNDYLINALMK